jgi:hypothetical protein
MSLELVNAPASLAKQRSNRRDERTHRRAPLAPDLMNDAAFRNQIVYRYGGS